MKNVRPSVRGSDAALLWIACALTAALGGYVVFGLIGAEIDRTHERTAQIRAAITADVRLAAQRPAIEVAARMAKTRLDPLDLDADRPQIVARFIHAAALIAARHSVRLARIEQVSSAGGPSSSIVPDGFDAIPLDVTLSGTYRDLVAVIRDLAAADVPMHIDIAAIERSAASSRDAPLSAHVHVALVRLSDAPAAGSVSRSGTSEESAFDARSH